MTLRSLFTAGALVTVGMLVGRVLGLFREMLLASRFGTGGQADTAIELLIIPDFITAALIGGAVSATLVPLFAARDHDRALALFWQALTVSVGAFIVIAGAVSLVTGAPPAFLIVLGSIPLTAATAIITAYLQYRGRIVAPAFANAVFNAAIILTLWLMPTGLMLLAIGIMLASLARLLCHAAALYRTGWSIPQALLFHPWQLDRALLKTYVTTVGTDIFTLFPQFSLYLVIATTGGGLALFNYAFKLAFVPATLGYSVTQLVLLPWFVKLLRAERGDAQVTYSLTLQLAWAFSLAVCLALLLAGHDIVSLCFGYGKMTAANVDEVAGLFAVGVWIVPGMWLGSIWQQILYAHGKPRMPLLSSVVQALAVIPLCWLLQSVFGLEGIFLAYALLQLIPVVLLSRAGHHLGIILRYRPSITYAHIAAATLAAWVPLALVFHSLALSAAASILVAILMGALMLAAGLAACPPVRQWGLHKMGRA